MKNNARCLMGILLCLAFICFLSLLRPAGAAEKKIECGVVNGMAMFMESSEGSWVEMQGSFEVKIGNKIKMGASGEAVINYSDGTKINVRPETEIEIKADGIRLNEGGIWIKLIKTKSGFKVDTPSVTIGARGTIFAVIKKQEKVLVKLVEGLINVVNRKSGKTLAMKAGDGVIIKAKEMIEINKLDKNKIDAILKENSFAPSDLDFSAVPDVLKVKLKMSGTTLGSENTAAPAAATAENVIEPAAEDPGANGQEKGGIINDSRSAGDGDEKTLKDLLGR
ncbi:MAG TPA: FecR family protein [Candidatus Wallbacteria bacterium]|nr:FecR family protein [Candidatus Wallbacteria bacterium]